jgi:hypothetical protein
MTKLNPKQQALLNALRASSAEGNRSVEVLPSEVMTAKALERKGLIILNSTQVADREFYEATLVVIDSRREVIGLIEEFMVQLQAACRALEAESDPNTLFEHMGEVKDRGRVETLRRALQTRAVELFEEKKGS